MCYFNDDTYIGGWRTTLFFHCNSAVPLFWRRTTWTAASVSRPCSFFRLFANKTNACELIISFLYLLKARLNQRCCLFSSVCCTCTCWYFPSQSECCRRKTVERRELYGNKKTKSATTQTNCTTVWLLTQKVAVVRALARSHAG